jgi:hypothetical protein
MILGAAEPGWIDGEKAMLDGLTLQARRHGRRSHLGRRRRAGVQERLSVAAKAKIVGSDRKTAAASQIQAEATVFAAPVTRS